MTTTKNTAPTWDHPDEMDDLFMALAEGDANAVSTLHDVLRQTPDKPLAEWPPAVAECWRAGLELGLENLAGGSLAARTELLLRICQTDFDAMALRDQLATAARQTFSDYLDPAGLLTALGIHDSGTRPSVMYRRWQFFQGLAPGLSCFDPAHGMGVVEQIDDLANQVRIRYQRALNLPLDLVFSHIILIVPDSLVQRLITHGEKAIGDLDSDTFRNDIRASLLSVEPIDDALLASMLVPACLSAERFARAIGKETHRSGSEEQAEQAPERNWDGARSLGEMVGLLAEIKTIPDRPENLQNALTILDAASRREDMAAAFVETLARLRQAAGAAEWLLELLRNLSQAAVIWHNPEIFVRETDKLSGRLVPFWFRATAEAMGNPYLADITLSLPLRLWSHVEKLFADTQTEDALLLETVCEAVRRQDVSADALLWLYRNGGPAARLLAHAPLLFKTLQKPVRGAFIKARKDLLKLLMDDQDFQRLIMRDGDPEAIASLVRSVRHMPLLDTGERQSLLVKIVRLFPDAIGLVEERRHQPARKAIGRLTSIRSYETRRLELERLVQVEVPANARAIAHARSYGDLRENAEYKAAKERQAYLTARRAELESDLHEVKATDFSDVTTTDVVVPGTTVQLRYDDGSTDVFHVLGLWDSVPERHIVSYETPVARILLGSRVNDRVEMPNGKEAVVESIAPLTEDLLAWVAERPTPEDAKSEKA